MDTRLERRLSHLVDRLEKTRQVSIRQLSKDRSEETAYYRLLRNSSLTEGFLMSRFGEQVNELAKGIHVLAISDTTDIDMSRHRGRIKPDTGIGYIGDGRGYGYNCHATLAVNADTGMALGLANAFLWNRPTSKSLYSQLLGWAKKRNQLKKAAKIRSLTHQESEMLETLSQASVSFEGQTYRSAYGLPFQAKESSRWPLCCLNSQETLQAAAHITYVQDMEGDLYDTFVKVRLERSDLLIRGEPGRLCSPPTMTSSQKGMTLRRYYEQLPSQGRLSIQIRDRQTGKPKSVCLDIRSAPIRIFKKYFQNKYQNNYPGWVDLYVVYAWQTGMASGEAPIQWCLLTTHPISTLQQACQITAWYSMRWLIELLFRLLKKEGFNLEGSELASGHALRKLGLITLQAAMNVLKLKQARHGDTSLPIEAVFDAPQVVCLEKLCPKFEGKTLKQQNPYPQKTLPWATWVIARLGGWKPHDSKRPPGILTLKRGLDAFYLIHEGFLLTG